MGFSQKEFNMENEELIDIEEEDEDEDEDVMEDAEYFDEAADVFGDE